MWNKLKAGDFVIFLLIIAGACLIWIRFAMMQTEQVYGEIWKDGERIERIELADGYRNTLTIEGKTDSIIEIDGKKMRFVQSKCPDHTCERTGWVSRVGDTAVCLPNRVLIKIVGKTGSVSETNDIDIVVQ